MLAGRVSLNSVMEVASNALDAGLLGYTNGTNVGTGGFVEYASRRLPVENALPIATPSQLAQVPIVERGAGRCGSGMSRASCSAPSRRSATRSSTADPGCCW